MSAALLTIESRRPIKTSKAFNCIYSPNICGTLTFHQTNEGQPRYSFGGENASTAAWTGLSNGRADRRVIAQSRNNSAHLRPPLRATAEYAIGADFCTGPGFYAADLLP